MTQAGPGREELFAALDQLLTRVDKPTRYLGGEWNSVVKDPKTLDLRMALAFPDVYEIGMSHLGFRILYALINGLEGVGAERVFMPWIDMMQELKTEELPLTSLETRRPLADFDLLGFSMQYELTMTNVLAMLDLGGVPLRACDRGEEHPLVLAGGPVVVNPEPFADFFDLILIGEAEQALPEAIERVRELRRTGVCRQEVIREVARIEGWYAPALYEVQPEPLLGQLIPRPRPGEDVPDRIRRRILYDLDSFPFPESIVVPHSEIVHDRVSWEIQRGCPVGCRFCQAGYIYRPTRERNPNAVAEGICRSVESTGFDEFSLTSLNTGEYGAIEGLITRLMDEMEPRHVGVGLSSLHASTLSEELVTQVQRVRKAGFTIAPEAGSQRLRDVINKNLTEEQILSATRLAFEAGWLSIKLYFMIGLPTETDEDVLAQVDLASRILRQGREIGGGKVKVTLSASTFVPKVFTPFQWLGMQAESDFLNKQKTIRRALPRGVTFRGHDHGTSWLEGALSRADRSVGAVILEAYHRGAVLDGWSEHFKVDVWRESFASCGIDPDVLATREIPREAALPWEIVDPLVQTRWLKKELARSMEQATIVPCGATSCTACAPFARDCIKGVVAENRWSSQDVLHPLPIPVPQVPQPTSAGEAVETLDGEEVIAPPPRPVYRYRARFEKLGRARFLGHLDLVRALLQGFRRAGVEIAHTAGFKPRPKISLSPALGLGISSQAEYLDVETHQPLDPHRFIPEVNGKLAEGLRFQTIVTLPPHPPALQEVIRQARYRAWLPEAAPEQLASRVSAFLAQSVVEVVRIRKGKQKRLDIRPLVEDARVADGALRFTIEFSPTGSPKPGEVVKAIAGEQLSARAQIERIQLRAHTLGRWVSPLVAGRVGRPR